MTTKLLHETKFLSLVETDGWAYATRNKLEDLPNRKANYVAVVAIVDIHGSNPCLCLINEYRKPVQTREWTLPSGLVDDGETVEEAAKRELFEETGLKVITIDKVSPLLVTSAGCTDEMGHIVFVTAEGELSDKYLQDGEDIEAHLFTRLDCADLLNGNMKGLLSQRAYTAVLSFMYTMTIKDLVK